MSSLQAGQVSNEKMLEIKYVYHVSKMIHQFVHRVEVIIRVISVMNVYSSIMEKFEISNVLTEHILLTLERANVLPEIQMMKI